MQRIKILEIILLKFSFLVLKIMRSNILKAILKLSNQIQRDSPETEMTSNRIQYVGNSLEEYIRNAFLDEEQQVNSTFSYLEQKLPPRFNS
ncbi:NgoPII family restriction endonuclease [Vibrio alginolyticus]|uniref:NgoPII family restriction endonuclease n=1 Tax=Vibrio alginolyticus TaxID=663 RepID=UPI003BAEB2CC|nr:NgoPII family restriction endonuclease [Vibrio alginolyticus]